MGVALQNTGLLDVQTGGLQFSDGFTSSGTFNVTNGSKLDLYGGVFHLQPGHQFTGGGAYGVLTSTATIDGLITAPNFQFLTGTMTISNQLTRTLHWRNGTLVGELTVATNGVLDLDFQSAGTLTGLLTNHGRIVWSAGSYPAWFFNNGRLENAADGLLDAQVDCQFYNFGGTAQINNAGVIRKSAGVGTGEFRAGVALQNTGLLDVQSGALQLADGYSQVGGRFNFGIRGPAQFGQINFPGAVTLTGTLSANLIGSFSPGIGDSFAVLSYASHTGSFTNTNLPPLGYSNEWTVAYGPTITALQVGKGWPRLNVSQGGGKITLNWSTAAHLGYALQYATNLNPVIFWMPVTNQVNVVGDQNVVTIPTTAGPAFYRLKD